MSNDLFFDVVPFLASIFIEVASPAISSAFRERADRKIEQDYPQSPYLENLKTLFHQLTEFTVDGVSTVSGLFISIGTAISIPFVRGRPDIGYPLLIVLIAAL